MNAPDSLPPREPRPLSDAILARLRAALEGRLAGPAGPDGELRDALLAAAAEARQRSLRAEELIVVLKTVLEDLTANRAGLKTSDEIKLREWLVTTSIRAYYGRE
jgi:hypothetical protein